MIFFSSLKNKKNFVFITIMLWFLFVFFNFSVGFAQTKGFVVPDSLKNKSYKYLKDAYYKNNKKFKVAEVYAKTIIFKGKKSKLNKFIAKGYRHLSNINIGNNLELIYLDSIIGLDFKKENLIYRAAALFTKGAYFDTKHKYKDALGNYSLALNLAIRIDKKFLVYDIKQNIGFLKSKIGKYKESLEIFKDCHKYNLENTKNNGNQYFITLFNLATNYQKINQLDSAKYYNLLGYNKAIKNKSKMEVYFNFNLSIILSTQKKYKQAADSIQKIIPSLIKFNDKLNLSMAYYYLGISNFKEKKRESGITYLIKMDSIIQNNRYLGENVRNGYKLIIDYYKKNKNIKKQLVFTEKLIKMDSIHSLNFKNISTNLGLKYDTPKLIKDKEQLINTLKINSKKSKNYIYTLIILTITLFCFSIFYFYKHFIFKKRFKVLVDPSNKQIITREKLNLPINYKPKNKLISKDKVDLILKKLTNFENDLGFLEIKLTQNKMAKNINTNSTYLSKVINQHKHTNFSTYINNLRVEYAIKKLKQNKKLYLLSIDGMANEFGFNNSETFSKAFFKKTGIYPSYFIKQLKKLNA